MNASLPVAIAAIATVISGVGIGAQQAPRFVERVDVARVIIDARVLDDRGNPVPGLTAGDFKVSIDGTTARVVLIVEKPEGQQAVHDIKTELTRRKGRVLATTSGAER